ncbi:MAG: ABC transporter substrate binding protein [Candidatus Omnitrophota bacterium]|nr:ABC transporter substrate binding protein [Candidatus Omnitrophota bacterium]
MKKVITVIGCAVYFFFSSLTCSNVDAGPWGKKRLLLINSYHKGYTWSDIITDTIVDYFNAQAPGEVEIKIAYIDTKRNNSEEFKQRAGLDMKRLIEKWKPDVIIGSDDNVSKYVIAPYFLNSNIPFVFCGLNDDPANYGFPGTNVTGMREIDLVEPLCNHLKKYARGKRIGYLTADKDVQRVMAQVNEKQIGQKFDKIYFINSFEEWKNYYLKIQDEVDILLMQDTCVVADWDDKKAIRFIQENIKIPSGVTTDIMQDHVLICISKSPKEHGLWAAEAALKILHGTKPCDIPIESNKKGSLILNLILADKLNIVFSPALLRSAETIIDKKSDEKNNR